MGFQGQFCPSSPSSPFSRPRGAGRGSWRERRAQTPLLQTPFPSLLPRPASHCHKPRAREETSHLMTGDQGRAPWGVAREWAGPCGGGAKVVYLIVWSRRPHSRRAASPAPLPTLQDRTRHEVASGHHLQPQPRLDKAASNRCVRDKGYTLGLRTKRRHPGGGRESLSKSETPPLLSSDSGRVTAHAAWAADAQELLKSPRPV